MCGRQRRDEREDGIRRSPQDRGPGPLSSTQGPRCGHRTTCFLDPTLNSKDLLGLCRHRGSGRGGGLLWGLILILVLHPGAGVTAGYRRGRAALSPSSRLTSDLTAHSGQHPGATEPWGRQTEPCETWRVSEAEGPGWGLGVRRAPCAVLPREPRPAASLSQNPSTPLTRARGGWAADGC